jgi:hypothetical protein
MATKTKCKHARLSREKVCYECGKLIDLSEKKHKYGAEKAVLDGITFDSKKEGSRYQALKIMASAGIIKDLTLQPEWDLRVNDQRICIYKADFLYYRKQIRGYEYRGPDVFDGPIVEDVKGIKTPVYRLKKKLMSAVYGIQISEI